MRNVVVFANNMKVADQWLRSSYSGVGRFFICTSFGDIIDILDKCEDEDIEGLFTKDADQNPHFRYIIQQVYIYKKRLYEKEMQSMASFAQNMVRKRHTDFKVRIQKHFHFDYPDSFFKDL